MCMKKLISIFSLSLLLTPFFASAHVKWFVHGAADSVRGYQWTDTPVITWFFIVLIIVVIGIFLERTLPSPRKFSHPFFDYIDPVIISLFSIGVGFGLVLFALQGYIFAPTLLVTGPWGLIMQWMELFIGMGLLLGIFVQLLSFALLMLYGIFVWNFGMLNMLETIEIPGIALLLLLSVRSHWALFGSGRLEAVAQRYREYAVPLLRLFIGLNLIVLGFSEKILRPELGMAFLEKYPWNFMQALGFVNFTDYWFVLSAGAVQALFGLIFLLGIVTRVNAFVVFCFFIPSLILLGPFEVFGHILNFSIWMVLMVFGSGQKLKIIRTTVM